MELKQYIIAVLKDAAAAGTKVVDFDIQLDSKARVQPHGANNVKFSVEILPQRSADKEAMQE